MTSIEVPTFGQQGRAFLDRAVSAMSAPTMQMPAYTAPRYWAPESLPATKPSEAVEANRPTWARRAINRGRAALKAVNIFNRFSKKAEISPSPIATAMQTPTAVLKDPTPTLEDVPAVPADTLVDQPVPKRLRRTPDPEPEYSSDPVEAKRQRIEWLHKNPPTEERPLAKRIPPHMRRLGAFQEPEPSPQPENQDGDNKNTEPTEQNEVTKPEVTTEQHPRLSFVSAIEGINSASTPAERAAIFGAMHRRVSAETPEQPEVAETDNERTDVISKIPIDNTIQFPGAGVFGEVTEPLPTDWTGLDFDFDRGSNLVHFPALNDTEEIPLVAGSLYESPEAMDTDADLDLYQQVSRDTGIFYPEGYSIYENTRQDLTNAGVLVASDVVEFIENVDEPAITDPSSNPIRDNYDKDAPFPHRLGIFDELSRKYQLFDHENPEEKKILEPILPKIEKWDEVKYTDLAADYKTQFEFAVETASEAHLGGVLNNLLDSAAPFTADPLSIPIDLLSTPQKAAMGAVYSWTAAEFVENQAAKLGDTRAEQRAQEIRKGFTSEVYANIVNHALPRSFINRRSKDNDLGYTDATPQELTNLYIVSTQMRNHNPNLTRGLADRKFGEIITALHDNIDAVPQTMRAGVLVEYASRQAA